MSQITITRGIVTLVDNDSVCPTVQAELLADEVVDGIEHVQPYGVHFHPPTEAECIVAAIGDDRANSVAFGINADGERPQNSIAPGEGGLYYKGEYKVFLNEEGHVLLGSTDAANFVALANKVLDELNKIRTYVNNHIHKTTATIGSSATVGVIASPESKMDPIESVAASQVKAH